VTSRILVSTTSHKREPLLETLDVFARLGFHDVDLNLHHVIECGVSVDAIEDALGRGRQVVPVVSGGWCDFFTTEPQIAATLASVDRQAAVARQLGAGLVRLFFGRLPRADYNESLRDRAAANLQRLSERHEDLTFVLENHDGASLVPEICRALLDAVDRPNVRMNVDPINFEHAGFAAGDALAIVRPHVAHVHLKGSASGRFCEFGDGDVDLTPVLQSLADSGYAGRFTVEYEGAFDGTVRLYRSVQRAREAVARATDVARGQRHV
jgi:sugar phosphate isomerase/epimerase